MAFWSSEKLKVQIPAGTLITPYDPIRVVRCAYEMGVGQEAYITSGPGDTTQVLAGRKIEIPPGQFGLLTTREVVCVPNNAIAFISIRAGTKFQGLVNVSGFHVDPGYRGQLKFAVYNAGSRRIVLDQGQPVFLIWYADLDEATADLYPEKPPAQAVITSDDVMRIQGEVASPAELKKRLDEVKADLEKRIHTVEQNQQYNKWLLITLITALVGLFVGVVVKPYLDGIKDAKQTPPATQAADEPPSGPRDKADGTGGTRDLTKPADHKPLPAPDKRDEKTSKTP